NKYEEPAVCAGAATSSVAKTAAVAATTFLSPRSSVLPAARNEVTMTTEDRNPGTIEIDTWPSQQVIASILNEDLTGVQAALAASGDLAELVEVSYRRLQAGGRIHYFGAGASGRLAFLDATESRPPFGNPQDLLTAHFPGCAAAFLDSGIDQEDAGTAGGHDAETVQADDLGRRCRFSPGGIDRVREYQSRRASDESLSAT